MTRIQAYLLLLWLSLLLLLGGVWARHGPSFQLQSNVLSLVKTEAGDQHGSLHVNQIFAERLSTHVTWLVGADTLAGAVAAANRWQQNVQTQPFFVALDGHHPERAHAWQRFYQRYGQSVLSTHTQTQIQQPEAYFAWLQAQIYAPFSGVTGAEWSSDPLLLLRHQLLGQQQQARVQDGWVVYEHGERFYALLQAQLKPSVLGLNESRQFVGAITELEAAWLQGNTEQAKLSINHRGLVFYNDAASRNAAHDVSTIGLGSLFGIVLLLLWVYRGLKPLLLTLLSLCFGAFLAVTVVWWVFGAVHVLTLALCSTLVGVSVDYCLHYLTERYSAPTGERAWQTMARLRRTLVYAFLTTTLAYGLLLLAPITALQQMAVFTIVGLMGALLTLFAIFPLLTNQTHQRLLPGTKLAKRYLQIWLKPRRAHLVGFMLLGTVLLLGLPQLRVDDDVAQLQGLPPMLQAQDQAITEVTGQKTNMQYFLVEANDDEQVLQQAERLEQAWWAQGLPSEGLFSLTQFVPSRQQQARQQIMLAEAWQALAKPIKALGWQGPEPTAGAFEPLSLQGFLKQPNGQAFKPLVWHEAGRSVLLVPIAGGDYEAMQALAAPLMGVSYHDSKHGWNTLFAQSRSSISTILPIALMAIGLLLWALTGWRKAVVTVLVVAVSALMALAALALLGLPLNLFSTLALALVMGIGIDYSLFLGANRAIESSALLSVFLANLTTELSFGLLVLSQTQALVGFGVVLSVGIFTAFLLAPMMLWVQEKKWLAALN